MQCPNCHQEIANNAQFCGYCGHRLEKVETSKPAEAAPPPEPPPSEPAPKELPPELETTMPSKPVPPPKPPPPPEPAPKELPPELEATMPSKPAPPPVAPSPPPKSKRGFPGWVLGLVGLMVVAAVVGALVLTGMLDFDSTQPAVTRNDAVQLTPLMVKPTPSPTSPPTFTCRGPISEWVEIESARLNQHVKLDGKMTNNKEWSDAACLDLTLKEPDWSSGERRYGASMPSRWWIKNDAEWLYLLVRVPAEELIDGPTVPDYGVAIDYFWPEWSEVGGWPYSDAGSVNQDNKARDQYGWDEETFYEDTQASPPGENNVEGAMSEDGTYVWFEFRKALDSGDDRDWRWFPGETIGDDESSLLLGAWGRTDTTWFEIGTVLHLAE